MKALIFTLAVSSVTLFACEDESSAVAKSSELLSPQLAGSNKTQCETNCNLVPDAGFCEAYIKRYYFDKQEGKCKEFIWGGCNGVVPFETLAECESCECQELVQKIPCGK